VLTDLLKAGVRSRNEDEYSDADGLVVAFLKGSILFIPPRQPLVEKASDRQTADYCERGIHDNLLFCISGPIARHLI
jgi:hypothetical protein